MYISNIGVKRLYPHIYIATYPYTHKAENILVNETFNLSKGI